MAVEPAAFFQADRRPGPRERLRRLEPIAEARASRRQPSAPRRAQPRQARDRADQAPRGRPVVTSTGTPSEENSRLVEVGRGCGSQNPGDRRRRDKSCPCAGRPDRGDDDLGAIVVGGMTSSTASSRRARSAPAPARAGWRAPRSRMGMVDVLLARWSRAAPRPPPREAPAAEIEILDTASMTRSARPDRGQCRRRNGELQTLELRAGETAALGRSARIPGRRWDLPHTEVGVSEPRVHLDVSHGSRRSRAHEARAIHAGGGSAAAPRRRRDHPSSP